MENVLCRSLSVLHSTLPWSGQRCCSPLAAGTERRKPDYEWGWSDESFYRKTGGLLDFCKAVYVSAAQTARLQHRRSPSGTSDISPRSSTTLLPLLERLLPDLMFIIGCWANLCSPFPHRCLKRGFCDVSSSCLEGGFRCRSVWVTNRAQKISFSFRFQAAGLILRSCDD